MAKEKIEDTKKRVRQILRLLRKQIPEPKTALNFNTVHQLMVATILSAQCTDTRVNIVTKDLFKKYRSVKDFAEADLKELEDDIHSTGFFANKAKALKNSAQELLERHNGKVPKKHDELVKLSGVGRKTASVILGAGYGLAEGVVVDTHVARLSNLLGLTEHKDPIKIERDLMELVPKKDWIDFSHLLILHGRATCKARKPDCPNCVLNKICPSARL